MDRVDEEEEWGRTRRDCGRESMYSVGNKEEEREEAKGKGIEITEGE